MTDSQIFQEIQFLNWIILGVLGGIILQCIYQVNSTQFVSILEKEQPV